MQVQTQVGSATSPKPGLRGIIIAHLCNQKGAWGVGFVLAVDDLSLAARDAYRQWIKDGNGLGTTQFVEVSPRVIIANMIAQDGVGRSQRGDGCLVSYDHLRTCLSLTLSRAARLDYDVHIPDGIGSGLAGGDKDKIIAMIQEIAGQASMPPKLAPDPSLTLWEFQDASAASYVKPKVTTATATTTASGDGNTLDSIFDTVENAVVDGARDAFLDTV